MKEKTINNAMAQMNGRFFGITRKDGSKLNAKLIRTTNDFLIISERNKLRNIKLRKDTISSITDKGFVIK